MKRRNINQLSSDKEVVKADKQAMLDYSYGKITYSELKKAIERNNDTKITDYYLNELLKSWI